MSLQVKLLKPKQLVQHQFLATKQCPDLSAELTCLLLPATRKLSTRDDGCVGDQGFEGTGRVLPETWLQWVPRELGPQAHSRCSIPCLKVRADYFGNALRHSNLKSTGASAHVRLKL